MARQVALKSPEATDHVIVLFVLALLLVFVSIQHAELLHELSLDLLWVRSFLVLFLPVDGNEISQLWKLLLLAVLEHDAHNHILEAVIAIDCFLADFHALHHVLRYAQYVVAGVLALLLE